MLTKKQIKKEQIFKRAKLKDCPFCGGRPNITAHPLLGTQRWHIIIKCSLCSCLKVTFTNYVKQLEAEWNIRR